MFASGKTTAKTGRTGLVRRENRAVRDDGGLFHPLGLTFFWAMQGWKHERDRFKANAEWAASRVDYLRILTEVGWLGREIDPSSPAWSDWSTVLQELLDYLRSIGLRVELTLVGKGTKTDYLWLTNEVCNILHGREDVVMDIECVNEYDIGGDGVPIHFMQNMARILRDRTPHIVALSSPGDWDALERAANEISIKGYTFHPDRNPADHGWRQVRQGYDFKNVSPLTVFNNEPAGPGSSVSSQTDPLILAMSRAVGVMCGGAGYVLHTGTGVFGDGKGHPTAGPRPANFWEIENIDGIVNALRGVNTILPDGLENWTVANTGWTPPNPVSPFQPDEYWEGDHGTGVNKAYSALSPDGRWIQMPCGIRGAVTFTASYPLHDVVIYDPLTLQHASLGSFVTGEQIVLPGGGPDAHVAYILQGRR